MINIGALTNFTTREGLVLTDTAGSPVDRIHEIIREKKRKRPKTIFSPGYHQNDFVRDISNDDVVFYESEISKILHGGQKLETKHIREISSHFEIPSDWILFGYVPETGDYLIRNKNLEQYDENLYELRKIAFTSAKSVFKKSSDRGTSVAGISARMKELRKRTKVSQEDMAAVLGKSKRTIQRLEGSDKYKGLSSTRHRDDFPALYGLIAYCQYFNTTMDYLLFGTVRSGFSCDVSDILTWFSYEDQIKIIDAWEKFLKKT